MVRTGKLLVLLCLVLVVPCAAQDADDLMSRATAGLAQLKVKMRDPGSFKLLSVSVTEKTGEGLEKATVCYRYQAENGYGLMKTEIAALAGKKLILPNPLSLTVNKTLKECGSSILTPDENLLEKLTAKQSDGQHQENK